MKSIALGLLALFAVAISSGVAFAGSGCSSELVKTTVPTTIASTDGSTPIVVPTSRDGG
jgi:hypothetical protein